MTVPPSLYTSATRGSASDLSTLLALLAPFGPLAGGLERAELSLLPLAGPFHPALCFQATVQIPTPPPAETVLC